jgi:hypothetical protein
VEISGTEDAVREELRRVRGGHAEGVARGDAALLHRGRREAREPDRVAGAVDVRHLGLERLRIDLQPAALVRRKSAARQIERLRRTDTAGGVQHHLGSHATATLQDRYRPVVLELDALDLGAEPQRDAAVTELVGEVLDQFVVDELQHAGPLLDQRHRDVERAEDGGIFHADDAGADHRQAARQTRDLDDLVAVEHAGAVERHAVRTMRAGADGDQDALALEDANVAVAGRDLDAVRVEETPGANGGLHRVAGELVLQHVDLVVERHVQARHQVLGADILLHPIGTAVEAALAPAGQVEHGLAQRLRGDGTGVHRDAADAAAPLDHQDRAAELRRLDRGASAGRPAADDDEVVAAHGGESEGSRGPVSTVNGAAQRAMAERLPPCKHGATMRENACRPIHLTTARRAPQARWP